MGLLAVLSFYSLSWLVENLKIINKDYFEFYIQPQEKKQNSAIPICYHFAYGNIDYPEIFLKLTFDLCYMHYYWEGKVRVPNVLKMVEKNYLKWLWNICLLILIYIIN